MSPGKIESLNRQFELESNAEIARLKKWYQALSAKSRDTIRRQVKQADELSQDCLVNDGRITIFTCCCGANLPASKLWQAMQGWDSELCN